MPEDLDQMAETVESGIPRLSRSTVNLKIECEQWFFDALCLLASFQR